MFLYNIKHSVGLCFMQKWGGACSEMVIVFGNLLNRHGSIPGQTYLYFICERHASNNSASTKAD